MVAEGISGSVEAFADEMNAAAAQLGLKESHFVNPNGLHDPDHYSSARDMAIIGRALFKEFPDHADLFDIGAIQLGNQIIPNHNGLLGRYPGADGMKTGFTCPAGWNVVASATRNGRRLIVVVIGSPSPRERNLRGRGIVRSRFRQWGGGVAAGKPADLQRRRAARHARRNLLAPQPRRGRRSHGGGGADIRRGGAAAGAAPTPAAPTGRACTARRRRSRRRDARSDGPAGDGRRPLTERVHFEPMPVFVGPKPGWTGPVLAARRDAWTTPAEASAFTSEKSPPSEGAAERFAAPCRAARALCTFPPPDASESQDRPRAVTTTVARRASARGDRGQTLAEEAERQLKSARSGRSRRRDEMP